ncbi:MAG: GAF domain-containing protein [Chloroflexaceae bacterium]|nr:GAF domain-containing protein [Chloroflexaceae bacterium]
MTLQLRKEKKRANDLLHVVIPLGVALSSERDFQRLLENILVEAMDFCRADGGWLFLREANQLRCVMLRIPSKQINIGSTDGTPLTFPLVAHNSTDSAPPRYTITLAALQGESVNVSDLANDQRFDLLEMPHPDLSNNYITTSLLTIPLKNNQGDVVGVLELFNARDPETEQIIAFDSNLQQMMESYSSLAVAALEAYIREQVLRQEIHELRIEIDEVKRQKQVSEIVDTELFQDLQNRARNLRQRRQRDKNATEKTENPSEEG